MKVYILIENNVNEDINTTGVQCFSNKDEANKEVKFLVNRVKNIFKNSNMVIEDCTDNDWELKGFLAYEDGNYNNNHYEVNVYEREI